MDRQKKKEPMTHAIDVLASPLSDEDFQRSEHYLRDQLGTHYPEFARALDFSLSLDEPVGSTPSCLSMAQIRVFTTRSARTKVRLLDKVHLALCGECRWYATAYEEQAATPSTIDGINIDLYEQEPIVVRVAPEPLVDLVLIGSATERIEPSSLRLRGLLSAGQPTIAPLRRKYDGRPAVSVSFHRVKGPPKELTDCLFDLAELHGRTESGEYFFRKRFMTYERG